MGYDATLKSPFRERRMRRSYRRPPIIEALCEFQFEPSQPWDGTFLGPIYDKVQPVFPKKRPVDTLQVQFGLPGHEAPSPSVVSEPGSMWFVRGDEKVLMKVGPDVISVHHLQPYSDWETLRGYIERALDAYRQAVRPRGVRRVGLRYINRLEVPGQNVAIGDYLFAVPSIPEKLPQQFSRWVQRVEIPYARLRGILALQTGSIHEEDQEDSAFLLDLDFSTSPFEAKPLASAVEWVERAHDEVERAFEACITPRARQLLQEVKDGE